MDKYSDEDIRKGLASIGVPDDLPEIALAAKADPSEDALQRIKSKTMERLATTNTVRKAKAGHFTRTLKTIAAAAAVLMVLLTTWLGPSQVWAGLQKALRQIPGFGVFEEETLDFSLVAAERVRVEHQGGYLEVSGLMSQPERTILSLYFNDVSGFNETVEKEDGPKEVLDEKMEQSFARIKEKIVQLYLRDENGREYHLDQQGGFSWASGGSESHVSLELPPLDEKTRLVTLVVPLTTREKLIVEIPLVSVAEIERWDKIANTTSTHGITVSGTTHLTTDTRVSLVVLPKGPHVRVDSLGRMMGKGNPATQPMTLVDQSGKEYELQRFGQTGWQPNYFELYFAGVEVKEQPVTLSIPVILLQEEGEVSVTVPVPREGTIELNQQITLGRFPLTLTRAEVVTNPHGKSLRVYTELGPVGQETFESFSLDFRKSGGGLLKYDENTGQMEYFEVDLNDQPYRYKFSFNKPVYSIEGPWEITFAQE
ncbi:MAG: hypothetical protein NUK65_02670 [Firmicutes bacterium]|nr:hypothetical protein [Bacillota bacterium]